MAEKTILISGGTLVTDLNTYPADLLIEGEKIAGPGATGHLRSEGGG